MLRQTSARVTKCLDKAVQARQLHDAETDPDKRLTYLHIEQTWCRLAHWYELMDELDTLMKSKPVHDGGGADSRIRRRQSVPMPSIARSVTS
jgi:hypothetical protein